MKQLIIAVILCLANTAFSQNAVNREVGDFHELKVFDLIVVKLIPSEENKVTIEGENPENVKVINDDGVLKLRMEFEKRFDGNATFVTVYFNSISVIDANEGSEISSEAVIKEPMLELKAQEGGKINILVETDTLNIKSVSGGIIMANGTAMTQDINLNSGGVYEAEELISSETYVTVTAGGSAIVYATKKVEAKVTAGGTVTIFGNPAEVKKRKFAGGKIKVMNLKN